MSSETFHADGIGPKIDLAEITLPPHVGARLAALYGRDRRFATADEWAAAVRETSRAALDRTPTVEDLCYADDGRHAIEVGEETHSFVCVLDPLVVPFIRSEPATVHSTTPIEDATVTFDVGTDGLSVDPDGAVVSLGVARDVDGDEPMTPERVYRETCPYVHAFESPAEYEAWADGVDAATTSVPAATGVAIARGLATTLFGEAE